MDISQTTTSHPSTSLAARLAQHRARIETMTADFQFTPASLAPASTLTEVTGAPRLRPPEIERAARQRSTRLEAA